MFQFKHTPDALENKAISIFQVRLAKRNVKPAEDCCIRVIHNPRCNAEEFRLSGSAGANRLQLDCGSSVAFLYGVGKILRDGVYENGLFRPGNWRGAWNPQKKIRCVYFASHFYNVFEVAPVPWMEEYIEDLALQGYNYLTMTTGSCAKLRNSPETVADLNRRVHLLKYGNELGMKTRLGIGNHGYDDAPLEWRAKNTGHSFFGTELCPNIPEALDYLVKKNRESLEPFRGLDVAQISVWPYDQGGCACEKCAPYGAKGMYKLTEAMLPMLHELFPNAGICWSTWEFDWHEQDLGEWETLYRRINDGSAPYIKTILADSHGSFPEYPLTHPLPGNAELITFPEISMWGRSPWGGFGATPLPRRFSALFGEVAHISCGGALYSEGIFEDFNKSLYANFFSSGNNDTETAVTEYANYEFGLPKDSLDDFRRLLTLMEDNHEGVIWIEKQEPYDYGYFDAVKAKPIWRVKNKTWHGTDEMLSLAKKIDAALPDWAKPSWRWRLFYLRCVIDFELEHNDNEPNAVTEEAMEELVRIYQIDVRTASRRVSPFTDNWIRNHVKEAFKINLKTVGVD